MMLLTSRWLLVVFAFITSSGEPMKTEPPKDKTSEPAALPAARVEMNTAADDPTFVTTRDIVSALGPQSITRGVLHDANGTIWCATWQGIMRYDDGLFTNVTLQQGLKKFHAYTILEDRAGHLWFGTVGGGVYRYDGQTFALFTTADGLVDNDIFCLLEDKAGNIWIGTRNGVSRYDGRSFANFTTQQGLSHNFVSSIAQDKTGKLWFGTNGGINSYAGNSFTHFTNNEGLPFSNVRAILEDHAGNIWISSQEGLCRYSVLAAGSTSFTQFTRNFVGNIFEDSAGNLWMSEGEVSSADMTLSKYDGKSFTKILVGQEERDPFFKQVFGIEEDTNGNIWFGTANGVCRYDPSLNAGAKSFTYFDEGATK